MKFEISRHAREEIERRGIPLNVVEAVLQEPQQVVDEYGNNYCKFAIKTNKSFFKFFHKYSCSNML